MLKGGLIALLIVISVSIAASIAHAKDGPSKEDYQQLEIIKDNQKVLEENRDAYNTFLKAKEQNEEAVHALNKNGWNIDWHSLTIIKSFR